MTKYNVINLDGIFIAIELEGPIPVKGDKLAFTNLMSSDIDIYEVIDVYHLADSTGGLTEVNVRCGALSNPSKGITKVINELTYKW